MNVNVSLVGKKCNECKIIPVCDYVWKPAKCNCGIEKYLASIKDDSAIICDKVTESYVERNKFN